MVGKHGTMMIVGLEPNGYNDPTIRIDYAGVSSDIAYYEYSPEKEQENLDSINNIRNVVKEYKNSIGHNKKLDGTEPIEID